MSENFKGGKNEEGIGSCNRGRFAISEWVL